MIVAASILSADFACLRQEIEDVEAAGADWHHVDVMDGHFVPPLTFGLPIIQSLKSYARRPLDVHIMVKNPLEVAEQYVQAGASRVTFHIEAAQHPAQVIQKIRSAGAGVGLALNPKTPICMVKPYLKEVDHVLVMSVEPGYAGQDFLSEVREKIRVLSREVFVVVDGGIKPDTASLVKEDGASGVVAGSWVYRAENRAKAILALKQS
ncbi:MAG: ribulose-phosphate 3-epimerase [Oligoflexales bacterium]